MWIVDIIWTSSLRRERDRGDQLPSLHPRAGQGVISTSKYLHLDIIYISTPGYYLHIYLQVRLYRQSATSLARPQYLGEQRVIQVGAGRLDTLLTFSVSSHARVTRRWCSPARCLTPAPRTRCSASTTCRWRGAGPSPPSPPGAFPPATRVSPVRRGVLGSRVCRDCVCVVSHKSLVWPREDYKSPGGHSVYCVQLG